MLINSPSFRVVLYSVFAVFVVVTLLLVTLNMLQKKLPNKLPEVLRTWEFLPRPLFKVLCQVTVDQEADIESARQSTETKQPKQTSRVAPLAKENIYSTVDETHIDDFDQKMNF